MKSRSPLLFAAAAALALLAGCQIAAAPARPPVNDAPAAADSTAAPVFSAGTWLAKSKDGETYYFFDPDGVSERTASQETGAGLGFTYTVQDGRGTFSMGSADNTSACTLEETDAEHITIKWEDGREESLSYISKEGSNEFQFYSNDALCNLAMSYYSRVSGGIKRMSAAAVTNEDGTVTIQVYENLNDRNSTAVWYTVDRRTGKGTDVNTGEAVDLSISERDTLLDIRP